MTTIPDEGLRARCVSLFRFLRDLTSLRAATVRDASDYEQVLWLADVPKEPECDSIAWRPPPRPSADTEEEEAEVERERDDVWLEVTKPALRPCPEPPAALEPWLVLSSLEDSSRDAPELNERARIPSPDGDGVDERTLDDEPETQQSFRYFVRERWLPWALEDRRLRRVQEIYSTLFAMHQRQERLGEEFQVALGLGLLCWKTDSDVRVVRHLVAAEASIEVDARNGTITVGPGAEGAKPRLEQDMLDPSDRPAPERVTELEQLVRDLGDAVWSPDDIAEIGTHWIHSASAEGRYSDRMDAPKRVTSAPTVAFAPALILRKRTDRSLMQAFGEILDQLQGGGTLPFGIARFTTVVGEQDTTTEQDDTTERDYLPLPANAEQLAVIDRLRKQQGVLVQGPPGTGKSHTIANLICHLLATGQRVLVTSHTARALEVLRDKLPGNFKDLCVDLLGAGRDAMQSLEKSVLSITEHQQNFDADRSEKDIDKLEVELERARREEAEAHAALRDAQEACTRPHRIEFEDHAYAGTLMQIAATLDAERDEHGWIEDAIDADTEFPLNSDELDRVRATRPDARVDFARDPETADGVRALFDEERRLDGATTPPEFERADLETRRTLAQTLDAIISGRNACNEHAQSWAADAAREILADHDRVWRERLLTTKSHLDAIGDAARAADAARLAGLGDRDPEAVAVDAEALRKHLMDGGSLGFWVFRNALVKRTRYLWDGATINGARCETVETLSRLLDVLDVDRRLAQLGPLWVDVSSAPAGSRAVRVAFYADRCEPLEQALALHDHVATARAAIEGVENLRAPRWHVGEEVDDFADAARQARDAAELGRTRDELDEFARRLDADQPHEVTSALATALRERDLDSYQRGLARAAELDRYHDILDRIRAADAPRLAEAMSAHDSKIEIDGLRRAWAWRRTHSFVAARIPDQEPALRRTLDIRQATQRELLCELAEARAWHSLLTDLDEHERQHLIAWTKAMRRVGKGTGKHAARHRRAAREHMEHCRHAIPAWILPIYRVAETIRPGVDAFDVVIIDEASQSGPEALFLLYLTKKVIVVGDDKQISPDYVGITRDDVEHLRHRHLTELPHSDAFSLEHSLFDLAEIRYGNRIRLREHFRCMPEIIRFSNDLCYRSEPLIPLKQFGAGRITPVVTTYHVADGYRDGTDAKVFNPAEADAIVAQIATCHDDPAYADKTFGVISLQGPHQAQLIEGKLLAELGPDAVLERQLVCGDAYAFQGDERDVMFLSLVAAPHAERRIGTLADQRSERRFNVAVSRAKEQLWLFHSVGLEDLSPKCLRHALLEYCLDPRAKSTLPPGIDAEDLRRAAATQDRSKHGPPDPFDSWFEVDVCCALLARGYRVEPQLEVAGYRIDLVVVGDERRLAVECDGDAWHGADEYDADQARQRALERCGWTFFRVRGSAFYLDRDGALEELWEQLEEYGIKTVVG